MKFLPALSDYRMNPRTEDLAPTGRHLMPGMIVLIQDQLTRMNYPDKHGKFLSPYDEARFLEKNRWAKILDIKFDRSHNLIKLVMLYEDGSKTKQTYNIDYAWYYKIASDGEPLNDVDYGRIVPTAEDVSEAVPNIAIHGQRIEISIFADWQVFSGTDVWGAVNAKLKVALEDDRINTYIIFCTNSGGPFGLAYASFMVCSTFHVYTNDREEIKELATKVMNDIMGDVDVSVRWISLDD